MSRINRPPVLDGEGIEATPLNNRYADFTQNDINEFNTRDAAIDLPQFKRTGGRGFLAKTANSVQVGKLDFYHAAPVTLNGQSTAPSTAYVIGDGTNPTPLGPLGVGLVSLDTTNLLRVYWSLNVNPEFTGTPWLTASSPSAKYTIEKHGGGGSNDDTSTNGTCWVIYLEWDITGPTLANFVPVPGQGDFDTLIGGFRGELLENTQATTVVPCWTTSFSATERKTSGAEVSNKTGWRGVSGTYYYSGAQGAVSTVYGLRLVAKGPMHPYQTGGRNYLVQQPDIMNDENDNVTLQHTVGRLGFILHKVK
jgi:hypothetical protein